MPDNDKIIPKDGKKYDMGKLAYDCIDVEALEDLAMVMSYGRAKYNENPTDPNWKKVDDGWNRYYAALLRHLFATRKGEFIDPESGFPHMAHVLFNCMCLNHFAKLEYEKSKPKGL